MRRYFTGAACKHGHVAERMTTNGTCVICLEAQRAKWEAANPESVRAGNRRRSARYISRIRDVYRARAREWHRVNRPKARAWMRLARQRNPEQYRTYARNRRALLKAAEGTHSAADIIGLFASQQGLCRSCAVSLESGYHVDHIVAVSKGGRNDVTNLQLLCPRCNRSKSNR